MKKHAYLIMAHHEFHLLEKLIHNLDDERADIYLHIDRKASAPAEDIMKSWVKNAGLFIIRRQAISWGGSTQIFCELELLKAAVSRHYQYYHLLSGVDFPLKSQDEINDFFDRNIGKEFLSFDKKAIAQGIPRERMRYYRFFQNKIGRNQGKFIALFSILERISFSIQRRIGIDRTRCIKYPLYKGTNWFSITDALAKYVVSQEWLVQKWFRYTLCADEIFLQTFAMSSPCRDNIVKNSLRFMDWERGSPYTFQAEDYKLLMESGQLFARKFSYESHPEVVDQIETTLNKTHCRVEK